MDDDLTPTGRIRTGPNIQTINPRTPEVRMIRKAIIDGGNYCAVVNEVITYKGSKAVATRKVREARHAGHEAFCGISISRQPGEAWPASETY